MISKVKTIIKKYKTLTWEDAFDNRIKDRGWKSLLIFCIPIYGVINHSFTRKTITPLLYWFGSNLFLSQILGGVIYSNSITYRPIIIWRLISGISELLMIKLAINHDRRVAREMKEKIVDQKLKIKFMEISTESFKLLLHDCGLGMIVTNQENKKKGVKHNKFSEKLKKDKPITKTQEKQKQINNSDLSIREQLIEAKSLFEMELISKEEYQKLKEKIIGL